jgi:regulatory protein
MAEKDPFQEAYQQALRLLAMREHSRRELKGKLDRRFNPGLVERVLDELAGQGLQSDGRFAEQYVHSRCSRGFGPLRIRAELAERGIDEVTIASCLGRDDDRWRALMLEVARRKFGAEPPADRQEQARRGRFLFGRGFPGHLINDYLFSG